MKKENKTTNRRTYRKLKKLKKGTILLFVLLLIIGITKFLHDKEDDPNKISEIGGPKIELNQQVKRTSKKPSKAPEKTSIKELTNSETNVKRTYHDSKWQVTPTQQTEPHTIDFSDGSLDRQELKTTILKATQLSEDDLIEWWLAGDSSTAVVATISNNDVTKILRLYLTWHKGEGWLVERIEELKELPEFK